MNVTGSATLRVPVREVWDALHDPAVLAKTVPGCTSLETVGDAYRMTLTAGVAQVSGAYLAQVRVTEQESPCSFTLRASGQGAPGTVDATIAVRLSPADEAATQVDCAVDAVVDGMLGGVGQRVLASAVQKALAEFFAAIDRELAGASRPVPSTAMPSNAATGAVAPEPVPAAPLTSRWALAAAFGAGGAAALVGVALRRSLAARRSR